MNENPYQPPSAELSSNFAQRNGIPPFYVVSLNKFLILTVATFGMYFLYWFYQNWRNQKLTHNENIWPVARSIFSIFTVHKLLQRVENVLSSKPDYQDWSPNFIANMYVVFSILSAALDILDNSQDVSVLSVLSLLTIVPITFVLYQAQKNINLACDDVAGAQNSRLTTANYVWIGLGGVLWLLTIIGLIGAGLGLGQV